MPAGRASARTAHTSSESRQRRPPGSRRRPGTTQPNGAAIATPRAPRPPAPARALRNGAERRGAAAALPAGAANVRHNCASSRGDAQGGPQRARMMLCRAGASIVPRPPRRTPAPASVHTLLLCETPARNEHDENTKRRCLQGSRCSFLSLPHSLKNRGWPQRNQRAGPCDLL